MLRKAYKLRFRTAVRFGSDGGGSMLTGVRFAFHADTLFSALFAACMATGESEALLGAVDENKLWFSDAFPYCNDTLFLPKPIGLWGGETRNADPSARKLFKRIEYVPFDELSAYLRGEADAERLDVRFGHAFEVTRVNVRDHEQPLPYQVGGYRFDDGCGLYLITRFGGEAEQALFERGLACLSTVGVGGKVSGGWGKFSWQMCELPETLQAALSDEDAPCQMLLSAALPEDAAMDTALREGYTLLVRRGGFTSSSQAPPTKKRTVYLLAAGSTFPRRFIGRMLDVGQRMPHPVWRYAKAGFMGVRV